MKCRFCKSKNTQVFLDLLSSPPSNSYVRCIDESEEWFPLKTFICGDCLLVQTLDVTNRDEFFNDEYAYLSSTSKTWLGHASKFTKSIIDFLSLDTKSRVLEVASNDGYLLKNFMEAGIPCKGCEPSRQVADISKKLYNIDKYA